jgi:hypothetical protein
MADVEFNEENGLPKNSAYVASKSPALVVLVQKWGLAKNDQEAEYVLIGIAGVGIVITLIVLGTLLFNANRPKPPVRSVTGALITSTP